MTILTNGPTANQVAWLQAQPYTSERERMAQIMTAMERSDYRPAAKKNLLARERRVVEGSGTVHGEHYDLRAYGLVPADS